MSRKMKPPQDSLYNGRNAAAGKSIDILDRDVKSLLTRGWEFGSLDKPPKKLADDKPASPKKGKK